jgi:hypothetical protein
MLLLLAAALAASPTPLEQLVAAEAKAASAADPWEVLRASVGPLAAATTLTPEEQQRLWLLVANQEMKIAGSDPQFFVLASEAASKCAVMPGGARAMVDTCQELLGVLSPHREAWVSMAGRVPSPILFLAYRTNDAGDTAGAMSMAETLTTLEPENPDAWYLLGLTRFNDLVAKQKSLSQKDIGARIAAARVALEKTLTLRPTDAAALDALIPIVQAQNDAAAVKKYTAARAALP